MNFKLNLHKIAIKVQNGNRLEAREQKKKSFLSREDIKQAIMLKIPSWNFMNKISFKKLIKLPPAKRVILCSLRCYQWGESSTLVVIFSAPQSTRRRDHRVFFSWICAVGELRRIFVWCAQDGKVSFVIMTSRWLFLLAIESPWTCCCVILWLLMLEIALTASRNFKRVTSSLFHVVTQSSPSRCLTRSQAHDNQATNRRKKLSRCEQIITKENKLNSFHQLLIR